MLCDARPCTHIETQLRPLSAWRFIVELIAPRRTPSNHSRVGEARRGHRHASCDAASWRTNIETTTIEHRRAVNRRTTATIPQMFGDHFVQRLDLRSRVVADWDQSGDIGNYAAEDNDNMSGYSCVTVRPLSVLNVSLVFTSHETLSAFHCDHVV